MRQQTLIKRTNARLIEAAEQLRLYGVWASAEGYPAAAEQMRRGAETFEWLTERTKDKEYYNDAIALLNVLGPKPKNYIPRNPTHPTTAAQKRVILATIKELEKVLAPWTAWRESGRDNAPMPDHSDDSEFVSFTVDPSEYRRE